MIKINTLKDIFDQSKEFKAFARSYGAYVAHLLQSLDVDSLARIWAELKDAQERGSCIFVIGNGGSAATASHMANDFSFRAMEIKDRPIRMISLTDNVPVLTATANDAGYDQVFLRQLQVYYRPGDRLLVISASGNSSNLVVAAEWVKNRDGRILGFLGFDGGKLKDICDVSVVVQTPKGEYGPVEDVHMVLDHLLSSWFHLSVGSL